MAATLAGIGIAVRADLRSGDDTGSMTSLLFGVSAGDLISFGARDARDPRRRIARKLLAGAPRGCGRAGYYAPRRLRHRFPIRRQLPRWRNL